MFDAHTHLQDIRLNGVLDHVIHQASLAGITGVSCCGTSPEDWPSTAEFALRKFPFPVSPAFGIHPWYVENLSAHVLEELEQWLQRFPYAAVGEIGLDGLRVPCNKQLQIEWFEKQLELAVTLKRPVILHGARAWDPLFIHLRPYANQLCGILIHGFSASQQILHNFLGLNAWISFGGSICNPNATRIRTAATRVPLDRLLVETDTPDMFPLEGTPAGTDEAGRPLNQPANLGLILQALSQLRDIPVQELAQITEQNAHALLCQFSS